jgi:tetratricopeptide (TPR) repeat protein
LYLPISVSRSDPWHRLDSWRRHCGRDIRSGKRVIRTTNVTSGGINDWKDWRPLAFIGGVLILVVVGFARLAGDDTPRPLELIVEEGRKLYKEGKLEESTVRMSEALRRYPGEPSVYMDRGITYLSRRDYVRALADFDEAIRGKPDFGEAYLLRSIAYDAIGALGKAEEDRKRAASFGVRDVRY